MLFHILDFVVDFFTHLNARKIFGGVLVLIGLGIVTRLDFSASIDRSILYMCGGVLVGGVGAIVIYYDMAHDKIGRSHNKLETLAHAKKQKDKDKQKLSGWHLDGEAETKSPRK